MNPVMVAVVGLVAVMLCVAGALALSFVRRARERSLEINAQIVEIHGEFHARIHEVNKRLDALARLERLARVDRATSAVHQAASEDQLPPAAKTKLLRHLQDVRDELSASEPRG